MANKSKQNQGVQIQSNEYLKARQLRIQENEKIMQDLGLKKIASSLTSLSGSQKMKNKKVKPTYHNVRDPNYIPGNSDDSEEEYQEVGTNVEVSKKKHCPQYIAPMSLNKIAKLARQHRVIAPKVSDSNRIKKKHSKATLSMGELISSKKGTRQTEISKQNLEKPSCIKRGSKKHLVLVDEDDDEDNDISQVDMEPAAGWEDYGNEGYSLRSQGYADQDDAYDDMDANNHNEIQGADSHDDSEGEDDALVQDQLQSPELEKAIEISKTNKRGPTMLHLVHTRKVDEREVIICNKFGQPVGPRTKEKDVVGKFSRFLGTIARNQSYAPMTYSSWHKVPHKDKMWEYVLEKYDVPYAAKTWVLKAIGNAYKVHKCRFKKKHFYAYKDNKTRLMNRPKNIPVDDFSQLLRLWSNKDVEKRCLRAKEIRMSQKNMHTAGPTSFAIIREEMRNDDPNKELPSLTKVFERTRKRTEGRAYLDTYDDTATKIEQMKNYKPPEDGSVLVDPFTAVMNKEYDGYLRLYGRGVTKKMMEKMDGKEEPYMIPDGLMESFKADIEGEKTQLLEMRKEIEEEHQRKKAELKAMHKDFDNKQANFEATMRSIMEKLPIEVLQDLRDE